MVDSSEANYFYDDFNNLLIKSKKKNENFQSKKNKFLAEINYESLKPINLEKNDNKQIKFLTYNIWFGQQNFSDRGQALLEIFKQENPHFICLQEVTNPFINEILLNNKFIRENYYISQIQNKFSYFTLILSKYPGKIYNKYFQLSNQGRSLQFLELQMENSKQNIAIATVHLESLEENSFQRTLQLCESYSLLDQYSQSFLMGDFNLDNPDENKHILESYQDTWQVFNDISQEPGHTMPSYGRFAAWRPDRIIYQKNKLVKPVEIRIIGKEPLKIYESLNENDKKDLILTPSDHFGLSSTFQLL